MNFITIVTAMSGHGGHAFARKIAENNPKYRWYDHSKNDPNNINSFPELKISPNHFRKRFSNGEFFPHLFDRIEPFLLDIESYYSLIEKEIHRISQGKKLIYVCHELPSIIRSRFPDSFIIHLLPPYSNLDNVIQRHMKTHMIYPLQENLHMLPGRKLLLNNQYWDQLNWVKNNNLKNSLLNYRVDNLKLSIEEIIKIETLYQKQLYSKHEKDVKHSDKLIIIDEIKNLTERDLKNVR